MCQVVRRKLTCNPGNDLMFMCYALCLCVCVWFISLAAATKWGNMKSSYVSTLISLTRGWEFAPQLMLFQFSLLLVVELTGEIPATQINWNTLKFLSTTLVTQRTDWLLLRGTEMKLLASILKDFATLSCLWTWEPWNGLMVNIRIVLHNEVPCFILKGLNDMQYEITLWGCYNNGCGGDKAPIMMGHRSALSFAFNFLSILKVCLGV